MFTKKILKDKIIWITGGGTGLGKSMGLYFAQLGANLVINGRRKEILDETAREIKNKTGTEVLAIRCDIRNYDEVHALIAESQEKLGPIDVLVNNAAGNFISPTEKLSHRAFDAVVDIVLKGTYNCTLAVGKEWIENSRRGNVLSITTTYAWTGSPYVVPSACGKAGVLALMRSLAVEWGPRGIRCNAIAPGPFPTKGAWSRLFPDEIRHLTDPVKRIPVGRAGDHQELSNLAAYMISDYAAYMNGEVVTLDGGEWLNDAGQFSAMKNVPSRLWEEMARKRKK